MIVLLEQTDEFGRSAVEVFRLSTHKPHQRIAFFLLL